jgi:hypothetical protein
MRQMNQKRARWSGMTRAPLVRLRLARASNCMGIQASIKKGLRTIAARSHINGTATYR